MSILEKIGLKPKAGRRPRRLPVQKDGRSTPSGLEISRRKWLERFLMLSVLVVLGVIAFPRVQFYQNTVAEGDIWLDEDLTAPFDFSILLMDDELEARREAVRQSVPPIFVINTAAQRETQARLDSLDRSLNTVFEAYTTWQISSARGDSPAQVVRDSMAYFSAQADVPIAISGPQWRFMARSYAARSDAIPTPSRAQASGPAIDNVLLQTVADLSTSVFSENVLNIPLDSLRTEEIAIRNIDPRVRDEQSALRSQMEGIDDVYREAQQLFTNRYAGQADTVRLGMAFFRFAYQPPLVFQREATEQLIAEQIEELPTNRDRIRQGMTIVRRGDVVTPEVVEQLVSLEAEQREKSGNISNARTWIGKILLVLAAYIVFFLYLYLLRPAIFTETRSMILLTLLMGSVVLAFAVLGQIDLLNELAAPVALVSIILTILFDSRVGLFATVTLAAIGGLIFGFDFEFTFVTIIVGFVAVFSVREVKNRSHLVISAAFVVGAYLLIGFGYALLRANPFESARLFLDLRSILVNGTILLLASPLMWAIERAFGMTTDIALLELSDTNRELLKQLSLRAPGTFNHSLQVANLAEAAADTVGANALLARVGALYHDIGKMNKPEYYIENQQPGDNPHDRVKPRMSAIIIGSHVKDGVEMGKQYKLPKLVLDFITTHHGTSLMEFFYRKAQEDHDPASGTLDETDFRYPGPKPSSSEQAIVMLADSVEAASRSLQKPTPKRLETLIDAILKARTEDGQLANSSLTFADLSKIKETFLSILSGVYHFRVKYPDQEPEGSASDGEPEGPLQLEGKPGLDVAIPPPSVNVEVPSPDKQRTDGSAPEPTDPSLG